MRPIRSAGKGSGSIELTLPAGLRDLVGLRCRIKLRDGAHPDIVLQPDLRAAQQTFAALWHNTAIVLRPAAADPPALPTGAFAFGLQSRAAAGELPFLCWRDGLALSAAAPHEPGAIARTLAAFGQAMAGALQIDPALSLGFGAACGFLVAGVPASPEERELCELAAVALDRYPFAPAHEDDRMIYRSDDATRTDCALSTAPNVHDNPASAEAAKARAANARAATARAATARVANFCATNACATNACAGGALSPAFWRRAAPLLAATTDVFQNWTRDPCTLAALRAAWRAAGATEMAED